MEETRVQDISRIISIFGKSDQKKDLLKKASILFNDLTDNEIIENERRSANPLFHVLVQEYWTTFPLIKLAWSYVKFRKYWNSDDYIDNRGKTVFQILSVELSSTENKITRWIQKHMGVFPEKCTCVCCSGKKLDFSTRQIIPDEYFKVDPVASVIVARRSPFMMRSSFMRRSTSPIIRKNQIETIPIFEEKEPIRRTVSDDSLKNLFEKGNYSKLRKVHSHEVPRKSIIRE